MFRITFNLLEYQLLLSRKDESRKQSHGRTLTAKGNTELNIHLNKSVVLMDTNTVNKAWFITF